MYKQNFVFKIQVDSLGGFSQSSFSSLCGQLTISRNTLYLGPLVANLAGTQVVDFDFDYPSGLSFQSLQSHSQPCSNCFQVPLLSPQLHSLETPTPGSNRVTLALSSQFLYMTSLQPTFKIPLVKPSHRYFSGTSIFDRILQFFPYPHSIFSPSPFLLLSATR